MERANSEEFFEVYKGVLNEYSVSKVKRIAWAKAIIVIYRVVNVI